MGGPNRTHWIKNHLSSEEGSRKGSVVPGILKDSRGGDSQFYPYLDLLRGGVETVLFDWSATSCAELQESRTSLRGSEVERFRGSAVCLFELPLVGAGKKNRQVVKSGWLQSKAAAVPFLPTLLSLLL